MSHLPHQARLAQHAAAGTGLVHVPLCLHPYACHAQKHSMPATPSTLAYTASRSTHAYINKPESPWPHACACPTQNNSPRTVEAAVNAVTRSGRLPAGLAAALAGNGVPLSELQQAAATGSPAAPPGRSEGGGPNAAGGPSSVSAHDGQPARKRPRVPSASGSIDGPSRNSSGPSGQQQEDGESGRARNRSTDGAAALGALATSGGQPMRRVAGLGMVAAIPPLKPLPALQSDTWDEQVFTGAMAGASWVAAVAPAAATQVMRGTGVVGLAGPADTTGRGAAAAGAGADPSGTSGAATSSQHPGVEPPSHGNMQVHGSQAHAPQALPHRPSTASGTGTSGASADGPPAPPALPCMQAPSSTVPTCSTIDQSQTDGGTMEAAKQPAPADAVKAAEAPLQSTGPRKADVPVAGDAPGCSPAADEGAVQSAAGLSPAVLLPALLQSLGVWGAGDCGAASGGPQLIVIGWDPRQGQGQGTARVVAHFPWDGEGHVHALLQGPQASAGAPAVAAAAMAVAGLNQDAAAGPLTPSTGALVLKPEQQPPLMASCTSGYGAPAITSKASVSGVGMQLQLQPQAQAQHMTGQDVRLASNRQQPKAQGSSGDLAVAAVAAAAPAQAMLNLAGAQELTGQGGMGQHLGWSSDWGAATSMQQHGFSVGDLQLQQQLCSSGPLLTFSADGLGLQLQGGMGQGSAFMTGTQQFGSVACSGHHMTLQPYLQSQPLQLLPQQAQMLQLQPQQLQVQPQQLQLPMQTQQLQMPPNQLLSQYQTPLQLMPGTSGQGDVSQHGVNGGWHPRQQMLQAGQQVQMGQGGQGVQLAQAGQALPREQAVQAGQMAQADQAVKTAQADGPIPGLRRPSPGGRLVMQL